MKLPNGYGNISKLSGNRRKPWRVRKTVGWEMVSIIEKEWVDTKTGKVVENPTDIQMALKQVKQRPKVIENPTIEQILNKEVKQVQKFIDVGYYVSRQEALQALAEYNADPYDLHHNVITFTEIYDKWSSEHFPKVSDSNVKGYQASFKLCGNLYKMKMVDIKLDHLQKVVDESGKNTPTLKKLKIMFGLMWDYCVKHEILSQDKRDMVRYVDISQAGNPNAYNRKPFNKTQVKTVWKWKDSSPYIRVILMLIYSGVRIGELLDLKKENINLDERWFDVIASKTESGIRKVPINEKVFPFFVEWYNMNDCEYLLSTPDGKHFEYRNYYDSYWKPFMEQMNMEHRPHDTRHTCISLLTSAGVDERIVKKIVGHKGQGVTQTVYTHFEIDELLDAINKI